MDQPTKWNSIISKRSRLELPLDVEHCSPTALRAVILDARTPASILGHIAQARSHDEQTLRDLVLCPNLDEVTLAFIALAASDEMRSFISCTRCVDIVTGGQEADMGAYEVQSVE